MDKPTEELTLQEQASESAKEASPVVEAKLPEDMAAKLAGQIQADQLKLASLTTIAYSTERMVERARTGLAREHQQFVDRVLKSMDFPPNLPEEARQGLLPLIERVAQLTFDRVLHEASLARAEAARLEGALAARQELLTQIRPPDASA